jgi:hypothetical protein
VNICHEPALLGREVLQKDSRRPQLFIRVSSDQAARISTQAIHLAVDVLWEVNAIPTFPVA